MSNLPQSGICLCPQLLPEPDVLAADAFESYSAGTETVPQISQNSVALHMP